MRNVKPPFTPTVNGPDDTSNFDTDELRPPNNNNNANLNPSGTSSKESLLNVHLPFVGFTSTISSRKMPPGQPAVFSNSNNYNHVITSSHNNVTVIESIGGGQQQSVLESDLDKINPNETLNLLTSSSKAIDQQLLDKLESDLKTARSEWSEVTAKLSEMRKEKSLLSVRLRSKEEEIEQQLEKNQELRQTLRGAERIKRQQLDEIIGLQADLDREKGLRLDCKF